MKCGKAPGYDNIHPEFLKNLGPRAREWLAIFLTRIISEKNLPKSWRIAKTVAIPKPGKYPKMASSYRPISLLSTAGEDHSPPHIPSSRRNTKHRTSWISAWKKHTGPSYSPYHVRRKWQSTTRQNRGSCISELNCRIRHGVAQRSVSKTIQSFTMLGRQCH